MTDSNDLSGREREILNLVAKGASNKEVAQDLHISTNTVKVHLRNIFTKVGVNSRTEAAMFAVSTGLVKVGTIGEKREGTNSSVINGEYLGIKSNEESKEAQRKRNLWILLGGIAIVLIIGISIGILLRNQSSSPIASASQPIITDISRWQDKAPLTTARKGHALVAHDNSIFAIAGQTSSGISGAVERYDPEMDQWVSLSQKPTSVSEVSAAVLGGKIYVPGGRIFGDNVTNIMEIYDPRDDVWEKGKSMPRGISGYALTAYEGKLYLFGGWDGEQVVDIVLEFDPEREEWSELSRMQTARMYAGSTIDAGKIYILGGFDGNQPLNNFDIYQPDLDDGTQNQIAWTEATSLPEGRYGMGITNLSGKVFVIGGVGESDISLPSLEYSLQTDQEQWQEFDNPVDVIWSGLGLVSLGSHLYLIGGEFDNTPTSTNLSYQAIYIISLPDIK